MLPGKMALSSDSYGRKAISNDFQDFDYIIAMDQIIIADLKRLPGSSKEGAAKLLLMRDFDVMVRDRMYQIHIMGAMMALSMFLRCWIEVAGIYWKKLGEVYQL